VRGEVIVLGVLISP